MGKSKNNEHIFRTMEAKYNNKIIDQKLKSSCIKKWRQKTIKSGDVVEIEIYPLWDTMATNRGKKINPTSEEQIKINERNRRKHVARLINANFTDGDLWITLGYKSGLNPPDYKTARKHLTNYLATLRNYCKKHDQEFKYIYVTEKSSRGRYHHHIICNFPDRNIAEEKWKFGKYPNTKNIKKEDGHIDGLANYITKEIKEEKNQKSYGWSRNLKKPKITIADTKVSKRRAQKMATNEHELIAYLTKDQKGAKYLSSKVRYSDYTDGAYIYAKLIKNQT